MTIVPLGKVALQVPVEPTNFIMELSSEIQRIGLGLATRLIEASLNTEVDRFLERAHYKRRKHAQRKETGIYCSRCRSHQRQDFHRNGYYGRRLVLTWGQVNLQVPQLKCRCGGNVKMRYQTIRSRQRIWEDVDLEIQDEYGRGLSYRQIKAKLDQRTHSSVGLRTLNDRVRRLGKDTGSFKQFRAGQAPPVVRVDGIWITVMFATGKTEKDQLGRQRPVKKGQRIPILAAQGVWPTTGRTQLLAWMRAEGEDAASWQTFLEALYLSGVTPQNGLALLVADGGAGFRAAYENVYWQTPLQRCVFHKLRNLTKAFQTPADMERQTARELRTACLRAAARIWQADNEWEARQRCARLCEQWQAKHPKAVKTLLRDFEETLAFYAIQEQAAELDQDWPAAFLRTTSPLERMFREFRQRYRKAIVFHSPVGLQALTAQIAARFS